MGNVAQKEKHFVEITPRAVVLKKLINSRWINIDRMEAPNTQAKTALMNLWVYQYQCPVRIRK